MLFLKKIFSLFLYNTDLLLIALPLTIFLLSTPDFFSSASLESPHDLGPPPADPIPSPLVDRASAPIPPFIDPPSVSPPPNAAHQPIPLSSSFLPSSNPFSAGLSPTMGLDPRPAAPDQSSCQGGLFPSSHSPKNSSPNDSSFLPENAPPSPPSPLPPSYSTISSSSLQTSILCL